jgi:beta-lactamase class A
VRPATGDWEAGPVELPHLAPADWSIRVVDLADGSVLASLDEGRVLRTASVGKLFLLVEVARQAARGALDLTEPVRWEDDERVEDSGLWHLLDQRTLSVGDLCVLIGAVSDNLATNVLVRLVGLPAVASTTAALGYTDSRLLDRVRDDRGPEHPPTLSVGTAAELADLMSRLHRGQVVDENVSALVLRWLRANTDLSMVAAAFHLDPLAHAEPDRGVRLLNKTGTISTARADVGVVEGPGASVAYAVLAAWTPDVDVRDGVLAGMREIGRAIRVHVGG